MAKPDVLGIEAFKDGTRIRDWWDWTLIAIIAASGFVGLVALVWSTYRSLRKVLKEDKDETALPRSVQERIHLLSNSSSVIRVTHTLPAKPSSFGVYLGALQTPVAPEEAQVLSNGKRSSWITDRLVF